MVPPDPGSARKGADMVIPSVDGPSWSVIHHLAENSSLSRDGKAAVAQLPDRLEGGFRGADCRGCIRAYQQRQPDEAPHS